MNRKYFFDRLFNVAENQAGFFSISQAEKAGYSRPNLHYQEKRGKFKRISRGVYRLGNYPASPHEDLFIALLKAGDHAVLSHASALSVYGLSDALPGEIHVTIPRTASRRRPGIKFHTKSIGQNEITLYEGLRITTVERTIIDLFESGFDPGQLRQAVDQALERGLTTKPMLINAMNSRGKFKQRKFENITSLRLS
jgi:predicted transcriptional regulator of viral defense system